MKTKIWFRSICIINLIGIIIGTCNNNIISIVSNGFMATIMAILSNDC